MPNESSGEELDINDIVELCLSLTTLVRVLDGVQVVRKYIREQSEIPDEIFSTLNLNKIFTNRSLSNSKNQ